MKSITATTLVNIFNGTTNLATLLGAYLCDTYFGRYKTLGFASIASFVVRFKSYQGSSVKIEPETFLIMHELDLVVNLYRIG